MIGALLLAFAALLAACGGPPPPDLAPSDPAARPSTVVLVIGCTFRADRLGVYGNPRETTPYLDALAAQGTRFERMLSNAPWTRPGIAALTTGWHPISLGVDDAGEELAHDRGVAPEVDTLAERFKAAGFSTVGVTANPNANAAFGLAQGFDHYTSTPKLWRDGMEKVPGEDVIARFLEQAATVEGPLYGQVVTVDTHKPFAPERRRRARLGLQPLTEGPLLDRYDAALTRVDDAVRALDAGLEALGRGDRLLVVVGDHGEGLFTPRKAGGGHTMWVYDANLRVPWILHGSGVAAGQVVGGLAQSIDLGPTLVELLGMPADPLMTGRSWAGPVRGEGGAPDAAEVLSSTRFGAVDKLRLTTPEWALVHNRSLVRGQGTRSEFELYAGDDLQQLHELSGERPEALQEMRARLDAAELRVRGRMLTWEAEADEVELEQLRALGYVDE